MNLNLEKLNTLFTEVGIEEGPKEEFALKSIFESLCVDRFHVDTRDVVPGHTLKFLGYGDIDHCICGTPDISIEKLVFEFVKAERRPEKEYQKRVEIEAKDEAFDNRETLAVTFS